MNTLPYGLCARMTNGHTVVTITRGCWTVRLRPPAAPENTKNNKSSIVEKVDPVRTVRWLFVLGTLYTSLLLFYYYLFFVSGVL